MNHHELKKLRKKLLGRSSEKPGINSLQRKKSESYWKVFEGRNPLRPYTVGRASIPICITTGANPF